jgi:hypothetical protein
MFKNIGFFILIFFSSLNIKANEEVLSLFCNFKFTEYKKGPAMSFENIVPDPKTVCNNWKCGESIKVFSESAQGQNFFFSNGLLKNIKFKDFKITDDEIFINTHLIDDPLVSFKYKITRNSGEVLKEIREFDFLELTKDKKIDSVKNEILTDDNSALKAILKFNGKCIKRPGKNF